MSHSSAHLPLAAGGGPAPHGARPRSPYFPKQTLEEITAATRAAVAEIHARQAADQARREHLSRARAEARRTQKLRETRLSEAGLALLAAQGEPSLARNSARRRLKKLRRGRAEDLLGWRNTQDVAAAIGMSRDRLSNILAGAVDPRLSEIERLAAFLERPLLQVIGALREQPRV